MLRRRTGRGRPLWRVGRIGVFAGVCCLTVGAVVTPGAAIAAPSLASSGQRPVYVTNAGSRNISTFMVDVATGQPALAGALVDGDVGVRQMVFAPDARTAYASNSGSGTVSVYRVGLGGQLTQLPGAVGTVSTGGNVPLGIAVTPRGHMLYVAQVASDSVASFTIASDGSLTPSQTTSTSVSSPRGLAVTPDGRFLFIGHGELGKDRPTSVGAVTAFAINGDGSLAPVGSPIRVGRFCGALATTPDGRYLYLTCTDTDEIYGFAIGADGQLTPLPRSPYAVSDYPEGIATSPDGRFVWSLQGRARRVQCRRRGDAACPARLTLPHRRPGSRLQLRLRPA